MRAAAVLLLSASACGRIGFDISIDAGADGPPRFGKFAGAGGGIALALGRDTVIVGGYTLSPIDLGAGEVQPTGGADAVLASYSASGEYQWGKLIGSTGDDLLRFVTTDVDGNVYASGYFSAPLDFGDGTITPAGDLDAFVASYTARGGFRWAHRIGTATIGATESAHGVAVNAGMVVVVGVTLDTGDAGGPSFTCNGTMQSIFMATYTPDGTYRSSKCFGTGSFNSARAVAIDDAGNIYMTGYYGAPLNFGGGNLPAPPNLDIYLVSFTSDGTFRWSRQFGGAGNDWGNGVAVDAAGNVTITGFFTNTMNPGGGPLVANGATDAFIASFDASGTFRWAHRMGGAGCDQGHHVYADRAGDVYLGGEFTGTIDLGAGPFNAAGGSDGFVAHYDQNGVIHDAFGIGGAQNDDVHAVVPLGSGFVVTGRTDTMSSVCPNSVDSPAGELYFDRI